MTKAFITGGTGFIGNVLLNELIEKTEIDKIILLVRDPIKAQEKLLKSIRIAEKLGKKLYFFKGDVSKRKFGLFNRELNFVKSVDEVYYLASNVSLSNDWKDKRRIFKSNFKGTKILLKIFKNSKNLKRLYYFSSAYFCGKSDKTVPEDFVQRPKSYRNYYEESKWLSENFIRTFLFSHNLPITIIRPSIVITEDEKNFLKMRYQTIYLFSRVLKKVYDYQDSDKPIRIVGKKSDFLNLISVEDLVRMILEIRNDSDIKRIYNLTSKKSLTTESLLKGIKQGLGYKSGFMIVDELKNGSMLEKFLNKRIKVFIKYNMDDSMDWNTDNTKEIRKRLKLRNISNNWLEKHIEDYMEFLINLKKKLIKVKVK